jgi:hypothetical protein
MKKFLIVSLAVLFMAALLPRPAAAGVGFKGGLGLSKLSTSEPLPIAPVYLKAPVGGIFFGVNMGLFTIQPEVLYVRIGLRIEQDPAWLEQRFDTIQVPVLLKFNVLPGPVSPMFYGGPYGAYRLSAKAISFDGTTREELDISEDATTTDFGLVFGGGIDFRLVAIKLSVEARYNLGLANLIKDPAPGESVKNRTIMVLVGLSF